MVKSFEIIPRSVKRFTSLFAAQSARMEEGMAPLPIVVKLTS